MRYTHLCFALAVCFSVLSCSSETPSLTSPSVTVTEESAIGSIELQETPTLPAFSFDELRQSTELNQSLIEEVTFFAGGAGCGAKNIGVGNRGCLSSKQGMVLLQVAGVFRVSDQKPIESEITWMGEKMDRCYEVFQFGDMVYFVAQGFREGEEVTFTVRSSLKEVSYKSIVQKDITYVGDCYLYAEAPAARLSWVIPPEFGEGKYLVTADGESGQSSLEFVVEKNYIPTFGLSVGDTTLPLVLGPERKLKFVYSGFQPNEVVSALLYKLNFDDYSTNLVRYINEQMDEHGSTTSLIDWDATLEPGFYWILVPRTIPDPLKYAIYAPHSSVYFYADVPPDYDSSLIYSSTEEILLRPSCSNDITARGNSVINLKYGIWGVNGLDILNQTKDKIVSRLFVNNVEIPGFRPNNLITSFEIPCGDLLENEYFIYNETYIGPFYHETEVSVRVDYSFTETITDGYDLFPQDGLADLYSPETPFSQSFTIKIVP